MIITIFIGILGLDIVVMVHELGHLIIAKTMGITVETFSIGMGKKIFSLHYKGTEYCLSIFPLGGYCKMKGEKQFNDAVRNKAKTIVYDKGSIFSAAPLRRILTYLAGPVFNFLFSILMLSIIWYIGFTTQTYSNKIILLTDYPEIFSGGTNPADTAGLLTGDKILKLNNIPIKSYSDIQEEIYKSANKVLTVLILRDSKNISLSLTPVLNTETGTGQIGVAPWINAVVDHVTSGSAADIGGLKPNDLIISANNINVTNYLDIYKVLKNKPQYLKLKIKSGDRIRTTSLVPNYSEDLITDLGISFKAEIINSGKVGLFTAIKKGFGETIDTFTMTAKSIYLLFNGINLKKAVSGPIRISYYVGEVASNSFKDGFKTGFTTIFRFLSMISVALGFANLLPIPIFDGGLLVFTAIELIKGKSLSPGTFYRYQSIGFFIIVIIFFLTTYSDISYLFTK